MKKATVVVDNRDILKSGGHVDPEGVYHWSGPGWYALNGKFEFFRVSSHTKERGFALEEAETQDYIGSPTYISEFSEILE